MKSFGSLAKSFSTLKDANDLWQLKLCDESKRERDETGRVVVLDDRGNEIGPLLEYDMQIEQRKEGVLFSCRTHFEDRDIRVPSIFSCLTQLRNGLVESKKALF